MDFDLNEEQKMLKKSARDFLEKECDEYIDWVNSKEDVLESAYEAFYRKFDYRVMPFHEFCVRVYKNNFNNVDFSELR